MLRIRLTRTGKKAQVSFRIVIAEHQRAVKKESLEILGHYSPTKKPKTLVYDKERIAYWIKHGAQPTETVASLLKKDGMEGMDKFIKFGSEKKAPKKKGGDKPGATA